KTAIPLIQKYGSVENLYKHIDEIDKPALKNKLVIGETNALISKDLATIHCEVPLEFDFEKAKFTKPDFETLRKIVVELEFKDIYNRMLAIYDSNGAETKLTETVNEEINSFVEKEVNYKQIKNIKEAEELAEYLSSKELIVFDTETDNLDHYKLCLAGVSFSTKEKEGFFVALKPGDGYEGTITNPEIRLSKEDFTRVFRKVFENKNVKKVCQNAKFDIGCMVNLGIKVENFYFDTMLASYVIDPDQKHGLNDLSVKYLKYKPIHISTLLGPKPDPSGIFEVECGPLCQYASEDADVTYRLFKILDEEIKKEKLTRVAYDIEFPLIPVLEDMERTGIKIDVDALHSFSDDLQKKLNEYTDEIYKSCGVEFNINSTKQLQEILFTKLGLKSGRKTKTGFSTDARSLEYLKGQHEIIDLLLDYRQVSKLKSTYSDALPNLINRKTGRIHTSFNQTVASTGRLSSNDPNLQNIPIRTELGREIRRAFVPRDKDHLILSADYSQIELRIMAHISGDEGLSKAFKEKEDIHRSTAALVFMVNPGDVTPDMRRKAKEVNFGILYGIGPFGLKTRLGVSQSHAKEIIDTYFRTFKRVKEFMDDSVLLAKEKGYAETLHGRRRFLRNINSSNRVVRQFEERVAINMRVQGTAADMIKLAMINIHKELVKRNYKTKMVLQVHDELVFDAHKEEVDEVRPLIKELMEKALPLDVPVLVDTGIGDNWLDAH
ncbi:MAG: DNA polymerase I, partial [Ignavibacteriales bacterium]